MKYTYAYGVVLHEVVPEHSIHETGGWESGKKRVQEGYGSWERLEREEGGSFKRMGSGGIGGNYATTPGAHHPWAPDNTFKY